MECLLKTSGIGVNRMSLRSFKTRDSEEMHLSSQLWLLWNWTIKSNTGIKQACSLAPSKSLIACLLKTYHPGKCTSTSRTMEVLLLIMTTLTLTIIKSANSIWPWKAYKWLGLLDIKSSLPSMNSHWKQLLSIKGLLWPPSICNRTSLHTIKEYLLLQLPARLKESQNTPSW